MLDIFEDSPELTTHAFVFLTLQLAIDLQVLPCDEISSLKGNVLGFLAKARRPLLIPIHNLNKLTLVFVAVLKYRMYF